jgi:hypothetical protein
MMDRWFICSLPFVFLDNMLLFSLSTASFGLRNKPVEWNDYSYEIVILLFGMDLFLEIVIPIGIHIHLRRRMPII